MPHDITEFDYLDPDRVDGVANPANGVPFLLLKSQNPDSWAQAAVDAVKAVDRVAACGDPHCQVCAVALSKKKLTAADRHSLNDSDFAYIDSKGGRHLPVNDAGHVRSALGRFNQQHFESDEAKRRAARKVVAAAKRFGVPVSDSDTVAQEARKAIRPDLSTPSPESLEGQTRALHPDAGPRDEWTGADDEPGELPDRARTFAAEGPHATAHTGRVSGQGDTAPNKTVPKREALTQTGTLTRKASDQEVYDHLTDDDDEDGEGGEVDGRGDVAAMNDDAGTGDTHDGGGVEEAERQTKINERTRKAKKPRRLEADNQAIADPDADKTPGDTTWEHKDAALADKVVQLAQEVAQLGRQLRGRENAEKDLAVKAGRVLSAKTESHIRRCITDLQTLVDNNTPITKELEDMTHDELVKLLDERDQAARRAKQAAKKAAAKKARKEARQEAKKAASVLTKAVADSDWAAKHASKVEKAAKAAAESPVAQSMEAVTKSLDALGQRVEQLAAQPQQRPIFTSGAGLAAALRGQDAGNTDPKTVLANLRKQVDEAPAHERYELGGQVLKGEIAATIEQAAKRGQLMAGAGIPLIRKHPVTQDS